MKTTISVPDEVLESVDRWASTLQVSRSELFTVAARRYIADLEVQSLTEQINVAVALATADDPNAAAAIHGCEPSTARPGDRAREQQECQGRAGCRAGGPSNAGDLATAVVGEVTFNTALAAMPGNVFLPAVATGLPLDSVVNVTAVTAIDKSELGQQVGLAPDSLMAEVDKGQRRVLAL